MRMLRPSSSFQSWRAYHRRRKAIRSHSWLELPMIGPYDGGIGPLVGKSVTSADLNLRFGRFGVDLGRVHRFHHRRQGVVGAGSLGAERVLQDVIALGYGSGEEGDPVVPNIHVGPPVAPRALQLGIGG